MPRYVILEHDHPQRHWDLMLESGDMLRTWRLPAPPTAEETVAAEESFLHRKMYLDYEGPVSSSRGTVVRWDHGSYTIELEESDRLCFRVHGQRLRGSAILERITAGWTFKISGDVEEK